VYFTELIWLFVKSFSLKEFSATKPQDLVLQPSYVHEKVGINQKGVNKKIQINGNKSQTVLNRK
jgi:hypothetical protein